jgi:reactive intermediate/imine deaminase
VPRTIHTDDAPEALGPYSQATTDGHHVYTAGQGAITPEGETLTDASAAEQTGQTLENVAAILDAAGCSMDDVLKTTVYLRDMDDYDAVNDAYAEFFPGEPPARTAVEVGALPVDLDVEIEAVATTDGEP